MTNTYGIHWFRRDLRVTGNLALEWSFKRHEGRVLGVFCFDQTFLARPDFSLNRFCFFLRTLEVLRQDFAQKGGDLLVLDVGPVDAFGKLFSELKSHGVGLPSTVSWNRDYEPFAIERDAKMHQVFDQDYGISVHTERDHLIIEPRELSKASTGPIQPYSVFTPFQKKWLSIFSAEEFQDRILVQQKRLEKFEREISGKSEVKKVFQLSWDALFLGKKTFPDLLSKYLEDISSKATIEMPKAGTKAAFEALVQFSEESLSQYVSKRDVPSVSGTSRMSIFFKNGSFTTAQTVAALKLKSEDSESRLKFFSELIWREFYYHVLFHFPHVEKTAFQKKYENITWENRKDYFEAWVEGKTGYPIVDAGMRELRQTGWMHNRVRMIVASFLTKDLLIDWRWGENHFMKTLLDGDLAPNNGGWQWAASTGCDPQPYFRIFNPVLQSKRFDPEGHYIRRFVPELSHLDNDAIHEPWDLALPPKGYPSRIVTHAEQSKKAVQLFKAASQ